MLSDFRTVELRQLRPRLRDELSFRLQSYGGVECYVIEDESAGAYYRIGLPEYTFLSLLDGRTTVGEAVAHTASVLRAEAFTEQQAAGICRWLVASKLIATDRPRTDRAATTEETAIRKATRINPLSLRVPLGCPHSILTALEPLFGVMFSLIGGGVWCLVMLCGVWQVMPQADRLWHESAVILAPHNWWWIACFGLVLKVVHEAAHGVACVRFGGRVREAGIVFLLLAPLPYVDLTSTWRLPKWQRIVTSSAGMLAELLVAALAAIVWANTHDEFLRQHLLRVILTAGVVTLLFNLNPLMRFDGYYILADLLELPNLAIHGRQLLVYAAKRWLLGVAVSCPEWPEGKRPLVALYGVASAVWRVVVSVSLIIAAATLFEGVGLLLAVGAVFAWFLRPLWQALRYIAVGAPFERPRRTRFAIITAAASALIVWGMTSVHEWYSVKLPGVVEYVDAAIVRAEASGFVEEVFVESGQMVVAGEPLVRLDNLPLETQRRELRADVELSTLRGRVFQQQGELAAMRVEEDNVAALHKKLDELDHLCDALLIRAPRSGLVAATDLNSLPGCYISSGQELLVIGDPAEKEIRVLIAADQLDSAPINLGRAASVRLVGDGCSAMGTLRQVEPRATTHPPHPALCAGAGGPIATKVSAQQASSVGHDPQELLEPHVVAYVRLTRADSQQFGTGQLATVRIAGPTRSLAELLREQTWRWVALQMKNDR